MKQPAITEAYNELSEKPSEQDGINEAHQMVIEKPIEQGGMNGNQPECSTMEAQSN